MKEKSVMILGASELQLPAIRIAKKMGYKVISVDYNPEAIGFEEADIKLVISTIDMEAVLEAARKYEPDYIFTSTSDAPVRTAAYVNEQLGRKIDISYADSICVTDKSYMRKRLKENEVPIPEFYVVNNFDEFKQAVNRFTGKCVVKPADNAGSRGVHLLMGSNIEKGLEKEYEYTKKYSRTGIVLVEEYMGGREMSVESITENGNTTVVTITDKLVCELPYFVEIGHSEPAILSETEKESIINITKKAILAMKLINGASHTEIKLTKDGPKIVEIAARLGGDFITSKLVPLSTGINMVEQSLNVVMEKKCDLRQRYDCGSAIRYIHCNSGKIKEINIDSAIYDDERIKEVVIYKKTDDIVTDLKTSNDRVGYVVANGKNAQDAIDAAENALKLIEIELY